MRCRIQLFHHLSLLLILIAFSGYARSSAAAGTFQDSEDADSTRFAASQLDFFENKIRPLLVEHCLECHGANEAKVRGGLWLTSRKQMLEGGDSGPAIVPGKPNESLLISAVHYEDYEMPPVGKLPSESIQLLEQWITMGAPDPRKPDANSGAKPIDLEAGRRFWSFQKVAAVKPTPPKEDDWSRTDIDRFIAQRWAADDIQPAPDTDRHLLLRRIHFALTGLPPTVKQIEAFVQSDRELEQDLAKVIDDLLDSPHFGERWGRHWLDVARFAESSGGGRSLMFRDAWRYRDYVIQAYNDDRPFDQMILEQLAGDLLPYETQEQRNRNLTATGFLALGPTNYEQQDKELLRLEVIDEQVDTTGRAFLGMTLGCARCHDHKFDPIPTKDYYALAGIFGSTVSLVDGNVSSFVTQTLATKAEQRTARNYSRNLKRLTAREKQLRKKMDQLGIAPQSNSQNQVVRSKSLKGIIVDNTMAKLVGKWTKSVYKKPYVDQGYIHDDGQPKGANQAIFSPRLEIGGNYEVRLAYSASGNRASNTLVTIDHQDGKKTLRLNQTREGSIDGLFASLGTFRFEADNVARVTISNQDTDGVVIADAVQFVYVNDGQFESQPDSPKSNRPTDNQQEPANQKPVESSPKAPPVNPELAKLTKEYREVQDDLYRLKSKAPRPLANAMSVKDAEKPKDGHVHIRGNVRQLGDVVPRGFLQVVNDRETWPAIPSNASGRLQLAQWIADPENPLTARVYVNRVWRHLFGRGLVETTDNFGEMGRLPSHPELLDFLADQFVQDGWSTKKLIRRILLSRVFRLSMQSQPVGVSKDPENRLLWRANRRRMDAEVLRDAILFASGQLDLKPGGLTIRKISQYDLGYTFDTRRRSVYVPAFRNSMLDLFEVFDIANPNMVTGNRNTSTLPTQALFLMNSPWVMDQAKSMAKQVCQDSDDASQRLDQVFLQLLGRPPTDAERRLATQFLASDDSPTDDEIARWQQLVHATIASLDFRYIH